MKKEDDDFVAVENADAKNLTAGTYEIIATPKKPDGKEYKMTIFSNVDGGEMTEGSDLTLTSANDITTNGEFILKAVKKEEEITTPDAATVQETTPEVPTIPAETTTEETATTEEETTTSAPVTTTEETILAPTTKHRRPQRRNQ